MSRSRKKNWIFGVGSPDFKNIFNRKLRRKLKDHTFVCDSGSQYKKNKDTCSWVIWDFKFRYSTEEEYRAKAKKGWTR
jgi:hypothetical protein